RGSGGIHRAQRAWPEVVTIGTVKHRGDLELAGGGEATHPERTCEDRVGSGEVRGLGHLVAWSAGAPALPQVATVLNHRAHVVERELGDLRGRGACGRLGPYGRKRLPG